MATFLKRSEKVCRKINEGHDEDTSQTSSSSSASLVNAPLARPSTKQIWERIYKRTLELHPELATSTSAFKTSPQDTQLLDHFDLLNEQNEIEHTAAVSSRKEQFVFFSQDNYNLKKHFQMLRRDHPFIKLGTAKHSKEDLRSAVESQNAQESRMVTHNPSCSLLSVRLPPIDERSVSPSGREALRKLREQVDHHHVYLRSIIPF